MGMAVGEMLRDWRERRRLSQLQLSNRARISTRHVSFVENGKARPSRELVLNLAEQLDIPLRERNHLLVAAGYAPAYPETALDAPRMAAVTAAMRQVLAGHEPYPALVVDRLWNVVDTNEAAGLFTMGAAAHLLEPPVNALRLTLHPAGMAPRIVNLGEWRAHLLRGLSRQVTAVGDAELAKLYDELRGYPCDQPEPDVDKPGPGQFAVPLRMTHDGRELAFVSTLATFGTPVDVTVSELLLEAFLPADAQTAAALLGQRLAATS